MVSASSSSVISKCHNYFPCLSGEIFILNLLKIVQTIKYVLLFGLKWAMIKKIAEISGEIIIYAL